MFSIFETPKLACIWENNNVKVELQGLHKSSTQREEMRSQNPRRKL